MSYASIVMGTPLGEMAIVASADGVVWTTFSEDEDVPELDALEARLASPIRRRAAPVDLSLVPDGFRRRVLEATIAIPYGELITYGDVAGIAGSRRAGRAAGGALSHCPIELFVPCHRVVHAGGTIGGYGRHEDRKRWLLRHEGAI